MTRIVIAPDKFKGSLSGLAFCSAVEKGITKTRKDIEIIKCPLADGGDGTIEVINYYLGGETITTEVRDPLGRKIKATYLYSEHKKTAYIEMAQASGISLLGENELSPLSTSTFGTGELIIHSIKKGVKHVILGIGGSATNDAGMGMARALGYHFYDAQNNELQGIGSDLNKLKRIDNSAIHPALADTRFEVACDVNNPLYGMDGAAHVYAAQKGASNNVILELDKGLRNFANVVSAYFNIDLQLISGAGAAGGIGGACIVFLNANLLSGIKLIQRIADFDKKIAGADWIISGEGKLDQQTLSGKVIKGIIDSAEQQKIALLCGSNSLETSTLEDLNIAYTDVASNYAKDINDSISNAEQYVEMMAEEFAKNKLFGG